MILLLLPKLKATKNLQNLLLKRTLFHKHVVLYAQIVFVKKPAFVAEWIAQSKSLAYKQE
jgi:hypothetical protein